MKTRKAPQNGRFLCAGRRKTRSWLGYRTCLVDFASYLGPSLCWIKIQDCVSDNPFCQLVFPSSHSLTLSFTFEALFSWIWNPTATVRTTTVLRMMMKRMRAGILTWDLCLEMLTTPGTWMLVTLMRMPRNISPKYRAVGKIRTYDR